METPGRGKGFGSYAKVSAPGEKERGLLLFSTWRREAPRGKPRGNLLRRSSIGYAGRVFARLGGASGEAWAEPCEAKNAILSCHRSVGATEDPPCGKPQGFAYSAVVKAYFAVAKPLAAKAEPLATKAGLAKKGKN